MRKKILPVLALCAITASPVSAIKFCPYTACVTIGLALEPVIAYVPELRKPVRAVQGVVAVVLTGLWLNYWWSTPSQSPTPQKDKAAKDETKSHS